MFETPSTLAFLTAILGDTAPGVIEMRMFSDVTKGQPPVDRRWYTTAAEFVDDLPRLCQTAETANAGIFFGVLRRAQSGQGKNEDTLAGLVLWTDFDEKDYTGGAEEARARLAEFGIRPSIIVRSGHGFHAYWLLTESLEPAVLSELCKQLADLLGSDSVHDAARILRLPGTYNRKDSANPVLVEVETFEPEHRSKPADIQLAIASVKLKRHGAGQASSSGPPKPPPPGAKKGPPLGAKDYSGAMSENVATLVRTNKKIGNLFFGIGKPKSTKRGEKLDTSGSGYDFSLTAALIEEGVDDALELGTAIYNRPDGHARGKGAEYITRTVAKALEAYSPRDVNPAEALQISKSVIFDSNPPTYDFTVGDRSFRVSADALSSPKKFCIEYLAATHTLPQMPAKEEWPGWVNLLLASAERREMPPEASTEPALREAVERAIDDLPITDDAGELSEGKAIEIGDGRKAFAEIAVRKKVRDDFPNVGRQEVSRVLRELGYASESRRVGESVRRLWAKAAGN